MHESNFRYDYIIIWSPALQYRDEIIDMIKAKGCYEIVEMFDFRPDNLHDFISGIYIYDSLPKDRIAKKVDRVAASGADMIIIFLKHYDPDLISMPSAHAEGAVVWKSRNFGEFKASVRMRYVPGDNMWAINIIHASDYEEQVDHLLTLVGREDGIKYLYNTYGKPDPVPGTFGHSNFVPPADIEA